ncbi:MAG: rod-binding protein [Nitrospirota bacterium]|jgi:flagellar protein FlgJ
MNPILPPSVLAPPVESSSAAAQRRDSPQALHQAAQDFESLFIHMMLKAGRESAGDGGIVPRGSGERFFTDLLDQELGRLAAQQGGFGIARQLEEQWKGAATDDGNDASSAP